MRYIIETLYAFHMPVFFALSGMFFKSVTNFKELFSLTKNKLLALGIPYIAFSVVMFSLQKIGSGSVRDQTSLSQLLNIYKQPIGYLWFLYVLFFVFAYIGFISIFIKNDTHILLIVIFGYIIASIFNIPIFFIQSTLVWAPMFYLGHILKNMDLKINKTTMLLLFVYFIHVPIFRVLHPSTDYASQINPQIWGIFSVIGIILGFSFLPLLQHVSVKGLSFIGQNTLVVYLVHAPTASVIRIILFKLGIYNIPINIIVGFGVSLAISLIAVYLSERVRLIKLVFYPLRKQKIEVITHD